ncbi:MAG: transcription antitermination factor NusB [Dethiosulfovibrio peptidovorans]|nr:MAG: transcription antitermination factor NusB [Dethiosulfovibrio peptidovorans]
MKAKGIHHKKRRARELALQILYALDMTKKTDPAQALDLFPYEDDQGLRETVETLVHGVMNHLREIDNMINQNVVGWRSDRMVAVDRSVIRMALYEAILARSVPVPVAISEAVELAKSFGTDESGRFVNGVLGKILRTLPEVFHEHT